MGFAEYLEEEIKEKDLKRSKTNYNVVMAYNMLNLLSSEHLIDETIKDIYHVLKPAELLMVNYPTNHRISKLSATDIEDKLKKIFRLVRRVGGSVSEPYWRCEK